MLSVKKIKWLPSYTKSFSFADAIALLCFIVLEGGVEVGVLQKSGFLGCLLLCKASRGMALKFRTAVKIFLQKPIRRGLPPVMILREFSCRYYIAFVTGRKLANEGEFISGLAEYGRTQKTANFL